MRCSCWHTLAVPGRLAGSGFPFCFLGLQELEMGSGQAGQTALILGAWAPAQHTVQMKCFFSS